MNDDSLYEPRNRLALEGEQLVLHSVSNGTMDLVSVADFRYCDLTLRQPRKRTFVQRILHSFESVADASHPVTTVFVPSGAYLILKGIPTSLQQRYGLEEEEGAVFLRCDSRDGTGGELRFNNGALVQLQELGIGQLMEVLSLAGTHPILYELELEVK